MLSYLQIRDFAIIDAIELELRGGLTVLTGETGAGKSIVVDALQLLAGARAGAEAVRHGAERAEITAVFDLAGAPPALPAWLEQHSIDGGPELSVRRVVARDGRGRAYLNGQAVPVQLLREAGALLIDIHGQHEFQSLVRGAAQRDLLDGYGRLESLAEQVAAAHRAWLQRLNQALELEGRAQQREARQSLLRHHVQELAALQLADDEPAQLAAESTRLANRGRLAEGAAQALAQLYEGEDDSAHKRVGRALGALRTLTPLDSRLAAINPLIEGAAIQIREAARELQHYLESLELDTARQDQVERRLAAIEELARKHHVAAQELPQCLQQLRAELEALESAATDLEELRREVAAALERYRELARQLSARRATTARVLSRDITNRMQTLGMAGGRLQVDITPLQSPEPAAHGIDQIEFRVSANPGQPLLPLAKVASGGELSRLSLAVQVACAAREPRCMVFDEVDAGIGGAVAEIVGRELRALGGRAQVLCVTHLAQVASQGHQHLRVSKSTTRTGSTAGGSGTTRTTVAQLDASERVEELARMLGGIEITAKAREHAREMLGKSAKGAAATNSRRRASSSTGR